MPVLINFKICDNARECGGIEVCPTKALYWDEKKKTIVIDNSKCIDCGLCEPECPVDAIRVAKNEEEYKKIKKEIEEDPRRISDLFVNRYGAAPVVSSFLIPGNRFDKEISQSAKLLALEIFNQDSIECLLNSIPVRELFKDIDLRYRKIEMKKDDSLLEKYKVRKLPALLFFKNGKLMDKIEGYFDVGKKKEMVEKVNRIIKSIESK